MAASQNSFTTTLSAPQSGSRVLTEQDHNARPPKRPRLGEDAVASIHTQRTQPETDLEVDHMILDYIAYQTTRACITSRSPTSVDGSSSSLSSNIAMSDAFLSIFKERHASYRPDAELRLRLLLLKLSTLLTQRLTSNPTTSPKSALSTLRHTNIARARAWAAESGFVPSLNVECDVLNNDLPLSQQRLEYHRARVLHELGVPAEDEDYEDAFYGTSCCLSLLDVLPLFMELSAARNAMDGGKINELWMHLACEFMLQACIEVYLAFGLQGTEAFDVAFFWGYIPRAYDATEVDEAGKDRFRKGKEEINAMFEDEEYTTEVEGWADMRMLYMNRLFPTSSTNTEASVITAGVPDLGSHLETVSSSYPIANFESTLLTFLKAISETLPEPVLSQLENGKLDGMNRQQTQEFLLQCGVSVAKLFNDAVDGLNSTRP